MRVDDLLGHDESESRAGNLPVDGLRAAEEARKEIGPVCFRNPDPCVSERHAHAPARNVSSYGHNAACKRVLDRVGEKVGHHLHESPPVAGDPQTGPEMARDADSRTRRLWRCGLDGLEQERTEIHRLEGEIEHRIVRPCGQ